MKIKRTVIEEINEWIGTEKILILKGARQVGKTTILQHIQNTLKTEHKVTKYFSIDQELNNPLFEDAKLLIKFIEEQYADNFVYIFLDEFQYIKNAGLFLKIIFDKLKTKCQLIVSGSSSLEITKTSEFLTGRKIDFNINTLSFKEFVSFKSEYQFKQIFSIDDFQEIEIFNKMYFNELKYQITEYLQYGGYPEVVITTNHKHKNMILKELISTYIQKDIAGFLKIENIVGFNNLLKILVNQSGNLVNKNELCNTLRLGHDTINKYLSILSGTYVLNFVTPYFSNIRKEITKMKKVYYSDFGIRKIVNNYNYNSNSIQSFDFIDGATIENFVFLELQKMNLIEQINYYRTIAKSEIDFIFQYNSKLIPLEVKFSGKIKTIPLAIKHFNKNYPQVDKNIVITKDYLDYNKEYNCYFIPVYLLPFIKF